MPEPETVHVLLSAMHQRCSTGPSSARPAAHQARASLDNCESLMRCSSLPTLVPAKPAQLPIVLGIGTMAMEPPQLKRDDSSASLGLAGYTSISLNMPRLGPDIRGRQPIGVRKFRYQFRASAKQQ